VPFQAFGHLMQRILRDELPPFAMSVIRGEYRGAIGIGVGVGDASPILIDFGDAGGSMIALLRLVVVVGLLLWAGVGVGIVEWFDSVTAVGSNDGTGEGEGGFVVFGGG